MTGLLNLLHRDKLSALSLPHLGGNGPMLTRPKEPITMYGVPAVNLIAKPTLLGDRMAEEWLPNMPSPSYSTQAFTGIQAFESPMPARWLCPRFP